jgi:hypothetical protein
MAPQRPDVLVSEETATVTTTPTIPVLQGIIAGPCFHMQSYPENVATMLASQEYGTLGGANPYTAPTGAGAVTIATPPGNRVGAVLDPDSVQVIFKAPHVEITRNGVGGLSATATTAAGSAVMSVVAGSFVTNGVQAGDSVILTDGAAHTVTKTVRSVAALSLTFTDEFPLSGGTFVPGSSTTFRVERTLADSAVDASFVSVNGSLAIVLSGDITLPVSGVAKTVNYAQIYVAYRSLRQDLARVTEVTKANYTSILGAVDAQNPLATAASIFFKNSSTNLNVFGIVSNDDAGYLAFDAAISAYKSLYAIGLLTDSQAVAASLGAEALNLADPTYVVAQGISQKFRTIIQGVPALPTTSILVQDTAVGATTTTSGTAPTGLRTLHIPTIDFIAGGVLPGDTITVTVTSLATAIALASYTITHVRSTTDVEVATDLGSGAGTSNITAVVKVGATVTDRIASAPYTGATSAALGDRHLDLVDPAASFLTAGVAVGDFIKMPRHPAAGDYTASDLFEIAAVVSNQRLRIVNNGANTALVANELPYGATRVATVVAVATSQTLHYEIVRTLDKAGQVSAMVAYATALGNKRVVLVYPDSVKVTSLVDRLAARSTLSSLTPAAAAAQPGYYLGSGLVGLTVSNPSQQGFTNSAVQGFDTVYNTTPYFSESQISALSNGGLMVFKQETDTSAPLIVHQLTTDISALAFSEFSMVKNFDFVAMTYRDSLLGFVGKWNVTPQAVEFINNQLTNDSAALKTQIRDKIGAPIIDAKVVKVAQIEGSPDGVEAFIEATFPKPLNRVMIHVIGN